jgi:hypothetical protein
VKKWFALMCVSLLASSAPSPDFRNVARQADLSQAIPNGSDTSKQFILETTGSGVAFIDYDNDGLLDIFFVPGPGATNRMYHNDGGGKLREVTEDLGLKRSGWGQGVCAGDYDNDGYTNLFVTYWWANVLYRKRGRPQLRRRNGEGAFGLLCCFPCAFSGSAIYGQCSELLPTLKVVLFPVQKSTSWKMPRGLNIRSKRMRMANTFDHYSNLEHTASRRKRGLQENRPAWNYSHGA